MEDSDLLLSKLVALPDAWTRRCKWTTVQRYQVEFQTRHSTWVPIVREIRIDEHDKICASVGRDDEGVALAVEGWGRMSDGAILWRELWAYWEVAAFFIHFTFSLFYMFLYFLAFSPSYLAHTYSLSLYY